MQAIKVALWSHEWETTIKANETDLWNYEQDVDHSNFSHLIQTEKPDPVMGWPVVVATGQRYRVHWGEGIDFEKMTLDISPLWEETDETVHIMTNFTDIRMALNFTDRAGNQIANETYLQSDSDLVTGDNVIYN